MSSYYTAAELEARRREQLRQELRSSIQAMTEQLRMEANRQTEVQEVISAAAADEDAGVSGYQFQGTRAETGTVSQKSHEALDFSALLLLPETDVWKERMQALRDRISERAVLSRRDEAARSRLEQELERLEENETLAPEERWAAAERRVNAYLAAGAPASKTDRGWLESLALEYRALCVLAGTAAEETLPEAMEEEIRKLTRKLERKREDAYIEQALTEIMEDLGCHVREQAVLGPAAGRLFSVEGHPLCDVFVGEDQSGFLFEPIAVKKAVSPEQKRQIQEGAAHICGLYDELEQRAAAKGILLREVYRLPVSWQGMREQKTALDSRRRRKRIKPAEAEM